MLADDLLEDARHLALKGASEKRDDQRARLARMFNHQKMREAAFTPKDKESPTAIESDLADVNNDIRSDTGRPPQGRLRS